MGTVSDQVNSHGALVPAPITSPAFLAGQLARLVPDKIITPFNCTIYTFQRRGGRSEGELKRDHTLPRDTAVISVMRGSNRFSLSYYPHDGQIQIVKELGFDQLESAISDLIAAGFPRRVENGKSGAVGVVPVEIVRENSNTTLALLP